MSEHLIRDAKISAEWLRGMESHIKCGSKGWIVGRSVNAASELEKCVVAIADLKSRLEKAEAERAHIKPLAWETVEAKRHCVARSIVGTYVAMQDAWWMRENAAMEEKIDGLEAAKAAAQADYEARIRSALKSSPPSPDQG